MSESDSDSDSDYYIWWTTSEGICEVSKLNY